MKIYKSLSIAALSLVLTFSVSAPVFAKEKTQTQIEQTDQTSYSVLDDNILKSEVETQASWDGQFKSDYTLPAHIVAAAASAGAYKITQYMMGTLNIGGATAAALTGMITNYISTKGKIRLVSTEKYRWIKKYTKAEYQATTKIYVNGKYKTTKSKKWISEVDTNIDSLDK
ncbi:hypothetical protein [Bacillus safensis]|uniref:hypothetical protein n=1 Tax=Bacillus safensis TaxID=561879 RepID=UPI0020C9423B|nr:hypothetical protein [Bacillus safensis]MCP8950944.1 hypothetical protein [Bacillus safensis]MCU0155143.1 hypothetical protein [Bacillus safensis]